MKTARFVLKIVAASLAVAAAVCCVIAYWDKIVDAAECVKAKVSKKCRPAEYADYADCEE